MTFSHYSIFCNLSRRLCLKVVLILLCKQIVIRQLAFFMDRTILAMSIKRCKSLHGHCAVLTRALWLHSMLTVNSNSTFIPIMGILEILLPQPIYCPIVQIEHGAAVCLFVLTDDQERQIDFAVVRKEHPPWPQQPSHLAGI